MDQYILNLIENHPKTKDCFDMDIVLESGAANGSYHIGCLTYISLLEKKNIVKVNRISGSSVGAIAGLYYFINSLQNFKDDYIKLRNCFKQNQNYSILKKILEDRIKHLTDKDMEKLNNKLFVVFHDVEKKKQIIKSTFNNKEEVVSSLLKSSHLPYIANNKLFYIENDKAYFDGGIPHIFTERGADDNRIIYINISSFNKLKGLFCTNKEINNYGRMLEGALDAHEFFLYERNSKFCSYVNKWKLADFTILRLKQLIFKLLFYFFVIINYMAQKIFPCVSEYYLFQTISPVVGGFYKDFLLFYCI